MKVKIVTVQLERLKLFTHQSQKKGPFPFPTRNLHPWSLWACPAGIRIAGSQGPIPCYMWQKTQGKGFISSLLNIAPPKLKGLIWASFVTFFFSLRHTNERETWDLLTEPTSLQSQETWPLPFSLRNTQWFIFTHCEFGIHPFNQACQHYVFIWPMRSPHS